MEKCYGPKSHVNMSIQNLVIVGKRAHDIAICHKYFNTETKVGDAAIQCKTTN